MNQQRGDDLDDDFVPDDLVAMSEDEGVPQAGDAEDIGSLLSADENEVEGKAQPSMSTSASAKKRKRRAKEKERKAKVRCARTYIIISGS